MNNDSLTECLAAISSNKNLTEPCLVHTFESYRSADGEKIIVRLVDYGPDVQPGGRYIASMIDANGQESPAVRGQSMGQALRLALMRQKFLQSFGDASRPNGSTSPTPLGLLRGGTGDEHHDGGNTGPC